MRVPEWMSNSHTPIAVDLGSASIKMLQLERAGSNWAVVASGVYAMPEELPEEGPERHAVLTEGCRKLLDMYPFKGRRAVSCLPVGALTFKNVRLPKMPAEERRQAVEWEAMDRLQLGEQAAQIQFMHAGEIRQGEESRDEIIVMAAPDACLREHVNLLTESGLEPIAIDAAPSALGRCFARHARRERDSEQVNVIVDIGRHYTKALIQRGQRVVFFKLIELAGHHLDKAVSEHLDISLADASELRRRSAGDEAGDEEQDKKLFGSSRRQSVERAVYESLRPILDELAREIGLCLRYFSVTFRGSRPDRVHLVGGEAHQAQVCQSIGEQLDSEVQVGNPLAGVDLSNSQINVERRGSLPEWAVAMGLALRTPLADGKRGAA